MIKQLIKSYNREAYFELKEFVSRTSLNDAEIFCKKLIRESPRLKGLGEPALLAARCSFNSLDSTTKFRTDCSSLVSPCMETNSYEDSGGEHGEHSDLRTVMF